MDREDLALGAESGNVQMIAQLWEQSQVEQSVVRARYSSKIDWGKDGAVAVKLAARLGQSDVVGLLVSYGVCAEFRAVCVEALNVARARGYETIVALLESVLPPEMP